jgi:hypothetical protein
MRVLQFTTNAEGCAVADRGFDLGHTMRLNLGSQFTGLDQYSVQLDAVGKLDMGLLLSEEHGDKRVSFTYYNRDNKGTGQINMVYEDKNVTSGSSNVYESKKFEVKRDEVRSIIIKGDTQSNKTEVYFNNQLVLTAPKAMKLNVANNVHVYPSLNNALTLVKVCRD